MRDAASKMRFRDQGLALSVTAVLHIGIIGWLYTVEMQETLIEPKSKTIQLQFIQIPQPIKELPPPKIPKPILEKKVSDKPIQKKRIEHPPQVQPKITKKVVNSQSEKNALVTAQKEQQVTREKKSNLVETEQLTDTQPKQEPITQMSTVKPTEPKAQSSTEIFDVKNYQPVSKKAPAYPEQALDRKLEGDCTIVYSVNEKGRVENPKEQGDCHPMFVRPSIQAALNFKYQPRLVDGKPTSVPNVKNTFQYRIK